ncbi:MAG: hypothetical protein ACI9K5_000978 [Gammaproteobacteria bacterium]|jgi:hypothetical protein
MRGYGAVISRCSLSRVPPHWDELCEREKQALQYASTSHTHNLARYTDRLQSPLLIPPIG